MWHTIQKLLVLLVAMGMLFTLCACGAEDAIPETTGNIAASKPEQQTQPAQTEQETTEEQKPDIPALMLQKSGTFYAQKAQAKYDNVILYEDSSGRGIINNLAEGLMDTKHEYISVMSEKYVRFEDTGYVKGVLTIAGEEIFASDMCFGIQYLGADYILLEKMIPCEEDDPRKALQERGGACYRLDISVYSLKEQKTVEEIDLSHYTNMSTCEATEDNVMVYGRIADGTTVVEVFFFGQDRKIALNSPENWLEGGRAVHNGNILDSKGNVILDFGAFDCRLLQVATKTDEYYLVSKDDHRALMDKNGKILIEGDIDTGSKYANGYLIVEKDSDDGVIDTEGNVCILFEYKEIQPYYGSIFAVETKEGWGFVDAVTGKTLMEPSLDLEWKDGRFEKENGYFLVNPFTGEVTEYRYLKLLDKNIPGIYSAYKGNGRAVITPTEPLTEFCYDKDGNSITMSEDGKVIVASNGMQQDIYIWE